METKQMSKVAEQIDDFLDNGGRELGFNEDTLPDEDDFQAVLQQMVLVWDYLGVTQKEYYGELEFKNGGTNE